MTLYRRAERTVWRVANDRVLVHPDGGDVLQLTGLGAMVWAALDVDRNEAELVGDLAEFGAERPAVRDAIELLVGRGLVLARSEARG